MTTLLEELVTYLDTQMPSLTAGTNLFANWMDDAPTVGNTIVSIYETPSVNPEHVMAVGTPPVTHPSFQLMVRGEPEDYINTKVLIDGCWTALNNLMDTTLGVYRVTMLATDSPFFIGRDNSNRLKLVANFNATVM